MKDAAAIVVVTFVLWVWAGRRARAETTRRVWTGNRRP